jgi:hypothetical protein
LIDSLVQDVRSCDVESSSFHESLYQLRNWKSAGTFSIPSAAENSYTRENLEIIFDHIMTSTGDYRIKKFQENQANNKIDSFLFSNSATKPENCLFYYFDKSSYYGLIGSEAKAINDSIFSCYAQAVSLSSELAIQLHCKHNLSIEQSVVPFVLTAWDQVQFGFVYLVEDSYPCSSIISRVLSLSSRDELLEVCRWIHALSGHCKRMIEIINTHSTVSSGSKSVKPIRCRPVA